MSGIGVIIILIQTLPFFGLPTSESGPLGAINSWPEIPGALNMDALAIGSLALAIMIFWPSRLRAYLPPPLAALVVGTLSGIFVFSGAPIIGDVPTGLPALSMPQVPFERLAGVVGGAMTLALLGSIDTLLTSLIADSITRTLAAWCALAT